MYQDKGQCSEPISEVKSLITEIQGSGECESRTKVKKQSSRSTKKLADKTRPYSWGLRNYVQLGVFLVTIAIGIHFFIYVHQAAGEGAITVSRPAGVEGFLPIGALMGWKLFLLTGIWDPIHPAAMVILGFAAVISFALRKSFCGWFCPVGTLSEWLWKLGRKILGKNYRLPLWLDYPLRSLKYLLLAFFVWTIFSMSRLAILAFLSSPYYKMSDVKMLFFFTQMSGTTGVVLVILVLASLIIRNFWCRYLCPYGALMGLFSLLSPTRVQRNPETCIDCKLCSEVCPYHLTVDRKLRIVSPECNGCMDCTLVCPVRDTLELKTIGMGKSIWSAARLGLVIIVLYIGLVYSATIVGHWKSSVSTDEFRLRLQEIHLSKYTHP
ncbi:MAG: 4Fe-4S binding protein [Deltaproteobacteria bacterium]|nr:MAG: 4Fe-4S binding protein [Deltaproteobacteria bacterium]